MLRLLILVSLLFALGFVIHAGFRRRLLWAINVTFAIYAAFFVIRLLMIWLFFDLNPDLYLVVAAVGLACFAIWFALRLFLERGRR